MGEDAAFKKGLELGFDKLGQARPGLKLDLSQEGFEVFLDHLVEDSVFGTPPLVVDAPSILRALIPAFAGPRAWLSILKAPSRAPPWPWLSRGLGLNRLIHRP